EFFIAGSL
ncbi:pyruvate formate lyase family protein, partial [Vibrio harveyi]